MQNISRIVSHFRLALFPIAYALSGVLIGSTLNRIMIADLGYSASLVALFFAIPLLVSPVRVWVGYRSDAFPLLGKRRETYIVAGALVLGAGVLLIVNLITGQGSGWVFAGLAVAFLLYGLGRNLSHNTFQALVAERFEGESRSRAATLYEVATMLGMVMGAGVIKGALKVYEPEALLRVAVAVAAAVLILSFAGVWRQEAKNPLPLAHRAKETNFGETLRAVVLADPQVRLFFVIVVLTFVGTLAQDVLLEPFGALVLGMDVGETTGLTQFWGIGVLVSMLLSGVWLLKAWGYMRVMRSGLVVATLSFAGPLAAGLMASPSLLKAAVFLMGVGTGLAGAGMLSGSLAFTSRLRAGMLVGVWGVANMTGHAFGSLLGGVTVDVVRALTGSAFWAYGTVFGMEMLILLTALSLTWQVRVESSVARVEERSLVAA